MLVGVRPFYVKDSSVGLLAVGHANDKMDDRRPEKRAHGANVGWAWTCLAAGVGVVEARDLQPILFEGVGAALVFERMNVEAVWALLGVLHAVNRNHRAGTRGKQPTALDRGILQSVSDHGIQVVLFELDDDGHECSGSGLEPV